MAAKNKNNFLETHIKLCRAVKKYPCVYDRDHVLYMDRVECVKAWECIAKECNESINSLKGHWGNIRKSYVRYLEGAQNQSKPVRPKAFYLEKELEFYRPQILSKLTEVAGKSNRVEAKTLKSKKEDTLSNDMGTKETPSIEPLRISTFFIKQKTSDIGTYIIKTASDEEAKKLQDISNPLTEKGQIEENTGDQLSKHNNTVNDDEESKRTRFRRACKRAVEVDTKSPKQSPEIKRLRSRTSQRSKSISSPFPLTTKPTKLMPPEKSPKKDVNQGSKKMSSSPSSKKQLLLSSDAAPSSSLTHSALRELPVFEELMLTKNSVLTIPPMIDIIPKKVNIEMHSKCVQTDEENMIASNLKGQGVQCDLAADNFDNTFIDSLKPQLAAMNIRQKLHFKKKIFQSLMDVFDNGTNFPERGEILTKECFQQLGETITNEELGLVCELAALVQAAKQTPTSNDSLKIGIETNNQTKPQNTTNTTNTTTLHKFTKPKVPSIKPNESFEKSPEIIAKPKVTFSKEKAVVMDKSPKTSSVKATDAKFASPQSIHLQPNVTKPDLPPHVLQKVVRLTGKTGGTVTTQGDNCRLYRVFPRGTLIGNQNNKVAPVTPNAGTFIIPRNNGVSSTSGSTAPVITTANSITPLSTLTTGSTASPKPVNSNNMLRIEQNTKKNSAIVTTQPVQIRPTPILRRYSICSTEPITPYGRSLDSQVITISANDQSKNAESTFAVNKLVSKEAADANFASKASPLKGYQQLYPPQTVIHLPQRQSVQESAHKMVSVPPDMLNTLIMQNKISHIARNKKTVSKRDASYGIITSDGLVIKNETIDENF